MTSTAPVTKVTLETVAELAAQLRVDSVRSSTSAGSGHPTSSTPSPRRHKREGHRLLLGQAGRLDLDIRRPGEGPRSPAVRVTRLPGPDSFILEVRARDTAKPGPGGVAQPPDAKELQRLATEV